MKMKKYIVDTMPEAMKLIRNELGQDAVILSTKTVRASGLAGILRKHKIEVIAAVEDDKEQQKEPAQVPPAAIPTMPRAAVPEAYQKAGSLHVNETAAQPLSKKNDIKPKATLQYKTQESEEAPSLPAELQPHPEGADFSVSSRQEKQKGEMEAGSLTEKLLQEISQMKTFMATIAESQSNEASLPGDLNEIRTKLKDQGIATDIWSNWMEFAKGTLQESEEEAGESIVRPLIEGFLSERITDGINESTRIVYVAGPTGVGKTTTIAKLAAEQMFKHKRKVGLITADTYRISAVEQLRTYAAILGIPLEVVQSPADTIRALDHLSDCDLILMDTAGRNYRNEITVSELKSLLPDEADSELIVVLSLTAKTEDMLTILDHFHKYGTPKLIFTKIDETDTLGALFNVLKQYPSKLAYITTGQNVPEDIMLPDPKKLADFILGSEPS
ncbi:flagellar biosynthesis regulator FlhF [Paenibacillus sp. J45TS6]|uniref:flagellar biosynthesis protein FlhF n=1 Tax=Paenibacillus sp. J45TS6 TaxID=2807196 RepID=UPI001B04C095|nr:flagellar biosynthesis protein FlhF [Paenibacillus sp. J45TS6]GIP43755.1 flagellar biosynthesis regulator FlhF [Paenibacillus sp. J45TS6]